MESLEGLAAKALQHDPHGQAIQFEGRWYTRDELRRVADQVNNLLAASGIRATDRSVSFRGIIQPSLPRS